MCGIFGWLGHPPPSPGELFGTLSGLLAHRGPDDAGCESGAGWGLGFRRLSILDLSETGHQPMCTPDGRFWLVFNGEVYNYRELGAGLEQMGERFRGRSDTEVLLALLAREGPAALAKLNGMFALALVDTVERSFLLARDRLGVKPLYYAARPSSLRFASELKALLAWPDAGKEIDPHAVVDYLALNYLPGETCIFKGYAKLPPAHILAGSLDRPECAEPKSYWNLALNGEMGPAVLSPQELESLEALLTDAVRIRLRSDVPVGVFLSGGIDSGLVAAIAARVADSSPPLALTVGYAEPEYDETPLARATAEHAGLEWRGIPQRPNSLAEIDRLAWFFDEPFGDASALPTFALCETAAGHATVFLSGDAGDEAFGGYRRYIEANRYRGLTALPDLLSALIRRVSTVAPAFSPLRYRLLKLSLPDAGMAAAFDGIPQDPALQMILPRDLRALATGAGGLLWTRWQASPGKCLMARQQELDYAIYLPDDILVKVDRASMAHSIEVRSPLLDYRLVVWAAHLPRAALVNATMGKLPLRVLARTYLPPLVQQGGKRGFAVPLGEWFRRPEGYAFARERLVSNRARQRGYWDAAGVERMLEDHAAGKGRDWGHWLWRLLFLDAWARHYADGDAFLQGSPSTVDANPVPTSSMLK